MPATEPSQRVPAGRVPDGTRDAILAALCACIPIVTVLTLPSLPSLRSPDRLFTADAACPLSRVRFESMPLPMLHAADQVPLITHVHVADVDGDGTTEVLACDAQGSRLVRFDRSDSGAWTETTLAGDLAVPAHVAVVDIDGDDDRDIVVAILGQLTPSDEAIGRVELLERVGAAYVRRVLLDDVRRVADVQPADLDGDGDVDLAVAVFGYDRGEVLWLENRGDGSFADHRLLTGPGAIHVPVADYDGDGDLDLAACVSQNAEEVWGFENLGGGTFRRTMLWRTPNFDLGSAGLVCADVDRDGDPDLILPAGDNLEDQQAFPQPYHGCFWFENLGDWRFRERRIAHLGCTYAAAAGDFDGDEDMDVALVSMANDSSNPNHASIAWLENDGAQGFALWSIDTAPVNLVTVAAGDLDGDGRQDLVAGSLNLRGPYQRVGGITAWINRGPSP